MVALFVTSLSSGSGKSAICAGLGKLAREKGHKVGFFRPVISAGDNGDAAFFKRLFKMDEPIELIALAFRDEAALKSGVKQACDGISAGKQLVIVEGVFGQSRLSVDTATALDAKVIVVADYSEDLAHAIEMSRSFGKSLLGVIINKVPASRLEQVSQELPPRFAAAGIRVLGILPEDRSLLALTVGELAEQVHGEMLGVGEKSSELVENVMLGASNVDAGPAYYGRKPNKAALLKSERPDMQMAALETSTACLILAGDTPLKEIVLDHAREMDVPIIRVQEDVVSLAARVEEAMVNSRFRQESKLPKLVDLMKEHVDLATISKALGI